MTNVAQLQQQARIVELQDLIRHHRILYYNDMPQISDRAFDGLMDELRSLDSGNTVLFEVGAPIPGDSHWIAGTHKIPMGSQNKVNTLAELREWVQKVGSDLEFIIEEKLDGLSVSCLARDTPVTLANGEQIPIQELVNTNKLVAILSWSSEHSIHASYATNFFKNGKRKCIRLTFEDGSEMIVTPDHRFYVENEGWIEAQNLLNKNVKTWTGE